MKLILFSLLFLYFKPIAPVTIEQDKERWKPYYTDAAPNAIADSWLLPFDVANRKDMKQMKVISIFGDHRDSYLKGHIHTAIDINPSKPKSKYIGVFPMAKGIICSVHLGENQRTVVVKHKLSNGQIIFTSYKHLKEVYVQNGQQVDQLTQIARLFTPAESKKYGGDYHHLHLEIRKSFDDYGCASWLTMNKIQLNLRFYNPLLFMKEKL
ncbi:murein DD-endopeptidase MepM/ murein hydrolase activator NlpD [Pedobacter sp. AK017]|uniref:M23 family metallopeptidase n=1 Tax=Pedobacter sp. AK017 TaxID=2723073 RepID=UPI001617468A|nr:M23 family metallopeptidase [Pedobacter sp. AK017]MBB5437599.1 murein DD-endopeptidase MepM/ murein hydrolase activator NlpD [Pedobacter sp. AK017]